MDTISGPGGSSLVERAKGIILKPKDEWPKIAAEQTTQMDILKSYVLPLAAIGPIASFIGGQVFGYGAFGISYRPGFMGALFSAIFSYLLTIVGVFVLAFIIDFLAEKFEGKPNKINAFKLAAYSATAAWLAGIFGLVPALGFFSILGLYSIYLFYTGAGPMMAVPEAKTVAYTVVTFLAAIVLGLIASLVIMPIVALVGIGSAITSGGAGSISSGDDDVTISIPGVGSIDTGKMEEAAERMQRVQKGEIKPIPTETLKAMLPESISGYDRTGFSSTAMGSAGAGVEGEYKGPVEGNYQFDLRVNDMLALSGLAGITGAMGIEQERETDDGYEYIGNKDGQWREEKWNSTSERGTYAIMVADRFRIEAKGKVEDIDVLKRAVASIDRGDLEDLAE